MDVWSIQQHTHDKRQRHILLPTPTVRGHAEACPSTTYAKYPLPTRALTLGGRVFFLLVYDVCEALGRAPCRACSENRHM